MPNCAECGGCRGCRRELEITPWEMEMLQTLGQIPFLPIARTVDDHTPVYLEEDKHTAAEYSLILQCLEKKRLITLDFEKPIRNLDADRYRAYPIIGSMALSARGQSVLETVQIQGVQLEEL